MDALPVDVMGVIMSYLIDADIVAGNKHDKFLMAKVNSRFVYGLAASEDFWRGDTSLFGGVAWDPLDEDHRRIVAARLELHPDQPFVFANLSFPSSAVDFSEEELRSSTELLGGLKNVTIKHIPPSLSATSFRSSGQPGMGGVRPVFRFTALSQMRELTHLSVGNLEPLVAKGLVTVLGASQLQSISLSGRFSLKDCVNALSCKVNMRSHLMALKLDSIESADAVDCFAELPSFSSLQHVTLRTRGTIDWQDCEPFARLRNLRELSLSMLQPKRHRCDNPEYSYRLFDALRSGGVPLTALELSIVRCGLATSAALFTDIGQMTSLKRLSLLLPHEAKHLPQLASLDKLEFLQLPTTADKNPLSVAVTMIIQQFAKTLKQLSFQHSRHQMCSTDVLNAKICKRLTALTELEYLSFTAYRCDTQGHSFNDDCLKELSALPQLMDLRLGEEHYVTINGLRLLATTFPSLRRVEALVDPKSTEEATELLWARDKQLSDRLRQRRLVASCLKSVGQRKVPLPPITAVEL